MLLNPLNLPGRWRICPLKFSFHIVTILFIFVQNFRWFTKVKLLTVESIDSNIVCIVRFCATFNGVAVVLVVISHE